MASHNADLPNGNGNGQKIAYLPSDNLVERFATRLLRRELFEALRDNGFQSKTLPEAKLLIFGSSVVQLYRPVGGFPISRQARDLDIGFILPEQYKKEEIPEALQLELKHLIGSLAPKIGADVEEDGGKLVIKKTYPGWVLKEKTVGKREHEYVDPNREITVEIKIPKAYLRSPLLPPVPYGDKGVYHEDVKEVLGTKLFRMTSSGFAIRDVIDYYNMMHTPGIKDVFHIHRDKDVLRTIALAYVAVESALNFESNPTFKYLEPTDKNVEATRKALEINSKYTEELKEAYAEVHDAVRNLIFPKSRSDLPDRLKRGDELGLTLKELSFMTEINGVEQLQGGLGVRPINPRINAGLLVSDETKKQFPDLCRNITFKHELNQAVEKAWRDRAIGNDGTPHGGFDDF